MTAISPAAAQECLQQASTNHRDDRPRPWVVGLGGSAGALRALEQFFAAVPMPSALAYVVVTHLSPERESLLPDLLQRHTAMRVLQVREPVEVEPGHVYVIPPGHALLMRDGRLELGELPTAPAGRVTIDLFLRTLADSYGPQAIAVLLSGFDSDGAVGVQRVKEFGGLVVAQEPEEAQHDSMPRAAIATGMADWVLPVAEMGPRIAEYSRLGTRLRFDEHATRGTAASAAADDSLREVLRLLRHRTGRDFSRYKKPTVLRRISRRMQVNGVEQLADYVACLRTVAGEPEALVRDLLISVTNFFRDAECFSALERRIPALFRDKASNGTVRAWIAGCATGEEAYSIAMLLAEHAATLDAPPTLQVFATDLDDESVRVARAGVYPATITVDVTEERLRRFFTKEPRGYRVRRELREQVLFASHDVLRDAPFSHMDLVSCRNLLIYLERDAQQRFFETARFALLPTGCLFLGASETVDEASPLFDAIDKKHRLFAPRAAATTALPLLKGGDAGSFGLEVREPASAGAVVTGFGFSREVAPDWPRGRERLVAADGRPVAWSDVHFRMLELLGPPSIVTNAEHDILHLSASAGRFLQLSGGEPSLKLLRAIHPALRIELRTALLHASQRGLRVETAAVPVGMDIAGRALSVRMAVTPMDEALAGLFLVTLDAVQEGETEDLAPPVHGDAVSRLLEGELERTKLQLRETVEQYEASTEELKSSNEELQAMNEELRAATEELETSREELQSLNEELRTANQQLQAKVDELGVANSDLQNLMDATAIATVFLDRSLRIMRYTPAAVDLFNIIPTDIGRPLSHLNNRLDYPELDANARAVLQSLIPVEREIRDAQQRWYLVRILPYRAGEDRIAGIVLTLVDVTERKRDQEALRDSEERLRLVLGEHLGRDEPADKLAAALERQEAARRQLQSADQAKDRFLAVLSHELRNPLASIANASEVLRAPEQASAPDLAKAREVLSHQVAAMRELLDDLLDLSRLKFGRLALKRRRVGVAGVLRDALETARPLVERRRHALAVSLPPEELIVSVDPVRMSQVVSNLLVNAAKYTDEGGHIELRAAVRGGACVIEVQDDGKGLDDHDRQAVFDMFWRANDLDVAGTRGLGIGLAVARSVVQMHGGTISAESPGAGRGSTFVISLPLDRPGEEPPAPRPADER
ncbi:MAG TPA: chemotaxis protein CheB, partial [Burkholderiaceae bacterium]